jgi:hypothetical protein
VPRSGNLMFNIRSAETFRALDGSLHSYHPVAYGSY